VRIDHLKSYFSIRALTKNPIYTTYNVDDIQALSTPELPRNQESGRIRRVCYAPKIKTQARYHYQIKRHRYAMPGLKRGFCRISHFRCRRRLVSDSMQLLQFRLQPKAAYKGDRKQTRQQCQRPRFRSFSEVKLLRQKMQQCDNSADQLQFEIPAYHNLRNRPRKIRVILRLQQRPHLLRKNRRCCGECEKNCSPKPNCCIQDTHESQKPNHARSLTVPSAKCRAASRYQKSRKPRSATETAGSAHLQFSLTPTFMWVRRATRKLFNPFKGFCLEVILLCSAS